jgi:hypothetical protein
MSRRPCSRADGASGAPRLQQSRPSHGRVQNARGCGRSINIVLLLGSPWAGTPLLTRRLATLVPDMTLADAVETTQIHRVAGLTGRPIALVTTRPCRAPSHSITSVGVLYYAGVLE